MKLGIMVNTNKHLEDILGITKSAISKGHEVTLFSMDDGTKLLDNPSFTDLSNTKGVKMSFCDYSAKGLVVSTEGIPKEIACGSQYDNATMSHESDKVIIL